jgi:hypothetical protein
MNWIPVDERLPEEDGEYLVTLEQYDGIRHNALCDYRFNVWLGYDREFDTVIAWMPLPAPYDEVH